jgi:hypothetical protein
VKCAASASIVLMACLMSTSLSNSGMAVISFDALEIPDDLVSCDLREVHGR